jgi:hypothetical protein
VTLRATDQAQSIALAERQRAQVRFGPLTLAPGATAVAISSDAPAALEPSGPGRPLAFAVYDLYVTISRAPPPRPSAQP